MSDIVDLLKSALQPRGTAPVVAIGWHCSSTNSAYMNVDFVHKCCEEFDRVIMRTQALGQPPNPLEQLAMMLIVESAYFKDTDDICKTVDEFRAQRRRKNDEGSL